MVYGYRQAAKKAVKAVKMARRARSKKTDKNTGGAGLWLASFFFVILHNGKIV